MGQSSEDPVRSRLFRAIHAEARKKGLDHDALHDICLLKFQASSMAALDPAQLKTLFRDLTGKNLRPARRQSPLPRAGYGTHNEPLELVTPDDLETLARACAIRGWGQDTLRAFIIRQLGHDQIRTRRDCHRVFSPLRAMNRRDGLFIRNN